MERIEPSPVYELVVERLRRAIHIGTYMPGDRLPPERSLAEQLPGGPPSGSMGAFGRKAACALYHLYRLNVAGRGDVLSALARQRSG